MSLAAAGMDESLALQAAIDFDDGGRQHTPALLPLPDHIRKLRRTLAAIDGGFQRREHLPNIGGVWASLNVAAMLYEIKADTAIDDSSIGWCSTAGAYANDASVVASRYLAATIMFNFAWMALEQAILEVTPAAKGNTGFRGRELFSQLRTGGAELYSSLELTWRLAAEAGDMEEDLKVLAPLLEAGNQYEAAFQLIRRIRNAFAHGKIAPPGPLDWDTGKPPPPNPEIDRFFAATRVALLLIARILADRMGDETMESHFEDRIYDEEADDWIYEAPIAWSLLTAHLVDPGRPDLPVDGQITSSASN